MEIFDGTMDNSTPAWTDLWLPDVGCCNATVENQTVKNNVSCSAYCQTFSHNFDFIIHVYKPTGYSLLKSTPYRLWFLIFDCLLLVPTITGNLMILIALRRYRTLRKIKGFILIGNLAVSDLLVGLVFCQWMSQFI